MNILILEDDLILQRLYKRILNPSLHAVDFVGTVAEAKASLDLQRPDLFISDMRLPDGLGSVAVAYCQATHPTVPIIVVSGTLEDAEGLDVFKKLSKPFSPEELLQTIQEAL